MKNSRLLLLVIIALLVGVGLAGCGPKKDGTTTQTTPSTLPPSVTTPTPAPATTQTPSVSSLAWTDIPNYPSLRQVQRASQIMPPTAGYAKAEVRVYETNDSLAKIVAFYKEQMPAKGWEETQWLDTPQFSNGAYSKNGENDLALVWVFSQEGKTEVMLMRGTIK